MDHHHKPTHKETGGTPDNKPTYDSSEQESIGVKAGVIFDRRMKPLFL
jgi:hypothetical protein